MTTIRLRRGPAVEWAAAATPLSAGEPGYQTDGDKNLKIGDGSTPWDQLPDRFIPSGGTEGDVLTKQAGGAAAWGPGLAAFAACTPIVMVWDGTTYQSPAGLAATGLTPADFAIRIWKGPVPAADATGGATAYWEEKDLFFDTLVT